MKLMLKFFVKGKVVNEKPYPRNSQTAPVFIISDERNFEVERARLIANINETVSKGKSHHEGKASVSFGPLTAQEWSNQYSKHLEHHLEQFRA